MHALRARCLQALAQWCCLEFDVGEHRRGDAEGFEALRPEELVGGERQHDRRHAGARRGVRGPGAAGMHDDARVRKQPAVQHKAEGQGLRSVYFIAREGKDLSALAAGR